MRRVEGVRLCNHKPLYSTPEFNLTVTGAPMISLRKPEGSLAALVPFSILLSTDVLVPFQNFTPQQRCWNVTRQHWL